ncbi:phosphate transport system protein [Bathymodiolus platifrons methanotrophic gill symbiont]|uniref:phosphate signaling complex protein PhoU n=1 Tax=Bathymodiolus platifrons methanotrophic gill symbiont TaxID=113268 RepID=UPI000B41A7D0|nr:phosphate signaling complex protein PhoU [Bathymodiolus platifrons methanotrophic gill symbiont]MCK5869030.1 phosphate signaling complex protein PhoU [Methyloprofundus sp.]TXK98069.1 phosphate transport system regulatory protein PhoU [Methylococcaceae bacterium CS5]TXK99036.1 phosphate transport system regulatory protein PhoU [Methylococcaceae bacterium CS4]TXL01419.1 phosphate transport system regulatory protein PhoU [Methylococcaceae bacterium HT1]TXL08518.1 phosphate transport system reg
MEKKHIGQHISHKFNEEIEDIRNKVLVMGGLVEQQSLDAMEALSMGDVELAEQVVQKDAAVNALEGEIDEDCLLIIAKRQPAAFDLRLLIAISKTITELERIGDQATRIAEMVFKLEEHNRDLSEFYELKHLSELVRTILHDALDVFARLDVESSVGILAQDKDIDREYVGIFRQLTLSMMEDNRNIKRALYIMNVIRSLERIGDHACNVCEYVIYAVKGEDVRHMQQEDIKQVILG